MLAPDLVAVHHAKSISRVRSVLHAAAAEAATWLSVDVLQFRLPASAPAAELSAATTPNYRAEVAEEERKADLLLHLELDFGTDGMPSDAPQPGLCSAVVAAATTALEWSRPAHHVAVTTTIVPHAASPNLGPAAAEWMASGTSCFSADAYEAK